MFSCGVLVHAPITRRPSVRPRPTNEPGRICEAGRAAPPLPPGFSCARKRRRELRGDLHEPAADAAAGKPRKGKLENHKHQKQSASSASRPGSLGRACPSIREVVLQAGEVRAHDEPRPAKPRSSAVYHTRPANGACSCRNLTRGGRSCPSLPSPRPCRSCPCHEQ